MEHKHPSPATMVSPDMCRGLACLVQQLPLKTDEGSRQNVEIGHTVSIARRIQDDLCPQLGLVKGMVIVADHAHMVEGLGLYLGRRSPDRPVYLSYLDASGVNSEPL